VVDNAKPSVNPVNNDSLTGTFKEILKKVLQGTDDMLPAKVLAYDRAANRARVLPLIQILGTDGSLTSRGEIQSIPVLSLGGGDFFINFNLPVDSLGWIKASDRDISLFLQGYEESGPNTTRLHTFSDAVFIPDVMTGYTIDAEDNEAMVIQNKTGTVRMSLDANRIKVTAPQFIFSINGTEIDISSGVIDITNGVINSDSDIDTSADMNAENVTAGTEVTAGTVALTSHLHGGSATAPDGPVSPTQAPIP
jgi:hypothetical protein